MKIDANPHQEVEISVLDANSEPLTGRVVSLAGHYITILCNGVVPPDGIVRITWANSLILGEVYGFRENKQILVVHIRHAIVLDDIKEIRSRWV